MSTYAGKDGFLLSVKRLVQSLPGRVALVMLITWSTAAVVPLVFRINLTILPVALRWASVAGVGLAAGLASRWCLNQNTPVLRLVTTFLSLTSGLWLAGILTQGFAGFRLFPRSDIAVDWVGLYQLAFGCLAAGLALYAWRIAPAAKIAGRKPSGRPSRSTSPSSPKRTPRKPIKSSKTTRVKKSTKLDRRVPATKKQSPVATKKQPLTATRRSLHTARRTIRANQQDFLATQRNFWATQRKIWVNTGTALKNRMQSLRIASRAVRLRIRTTGQAVQNRLLSGSQTARTQLRNRLASRSKKSSVKFQNRQHSIRSARSEDSPVRLVGATEHRCPYCLEVVVRNDPRGVKICPICHTHHHADCWAVTGTCQVPHQYE
jgi:hypothetical protein